MGWGRNIISYAYREGGSNPRFPTLIGSVGGGCYWSVEDKGEGGA